jgi:hypothetical protein
MNNNQTRTSLNMVLREYYLDWVNNWVSTEAFAGYHELSFEQARLVIDLGRDLHESYCRNVNKG